MSGIDDLPISNAVPLSKGYIPTVFSMVLRSIRNQPGDMEPSVQAYKISLIGCYCVTLNVMSCLLVILLLGVCDVWLQETSLGIVFNR